MADDLRALLDVRDLDALVHGTVAELDSGDWQAYGRRFAPGVEFVLPAHAAPAATDPGATTITITGVEHFIPVLRQTLDGFDAVQHHISNTVHDIDGDTATTACYVVAEHFLADVPGGTSTSIGGSYAITARRNGDRWELTGWQFTPAWVRGNPDLFAAAARRGAGGVDPAEDDDGEQRVGAPVGAGEGSHHG